MVGVSLTGHKVVESDDFVDKPVVVASDVIALPLDLVVLVAVGEVVLQVVHVDERKAEGDTQAEGHDLQKNQRP